MLWIVVLLNHGENLWFTKTLAHFDFLALVQFRRVRSYAWSIRYFLTEFHRIRVVSVV